MPIIEISDVHESSANHDDTKPRQHPLGMGYSGGECESVEVETAGMLMEEEREIRYVVVDATGRSTFVYAPGQPHQADDGQGLNQLLTDGWQTISQTKFVDDDEQTEEPCSLILLAKAG